MSRDPFMTLRTRPIVRPEPKPRRRCRQCGCVLRISNPGDICAPCEGVLLPDDVPEWVLALADSDGNGMGILSRVLTGVGVRRLMAARDRTIREAYRNGTTKDERR